MGQPMTLDAPLARNRGEERLVHRWLTFLFLAMMWFVAIVYLWAAAFAV